MIEYDKHTLISFSYSILEASNLQTWEEIGDVEAGNRKEQWSGPIFSINLPSYKNLIVPPPRLFI